MPGTPFGASVRESDGVTVVDFSGDINRDATDGFEEAYEQAAASPGFIPADRSQPAVRATALWSSP